MALCSLLVVPTDERAAAGFTFDHDQLHRDMSTAIAPNDLPRLLDPTTVQDAATRAGYWNFTHQNAHDNFNLAIFGVEFNQQLADSNLTQSESLTFWTFVNHAEHFRNNQIP